MQHLRSDARSYPTQATFVCPEYPQKAARRPIGDSFLQSEAQLRELSDHLLNVRETERTNIAREIHDELGQQLTILKMDVDKNPHVANAFQIQGVPTLILFKNGDIKWRQSGVPTVKQLQQVIERVSDKVQ